MTKKVDKLERVIVFWKGFASGFASALVGIAGLVALVNYIVQIVGVVAK